MNPWGIAMLLNLRSTAMNRMLSKRQVTALVLYSSQHIARLEAAGQFPKRVKLGNNRVGWVEAEVQDWLQQRIDARDALMPSP
jgi:prophage regulatory protein